MAAEMPTIMDTNIAKEAIIIPYMLEVLERDIKVMMESNLKMKEIYARMLRKAQNNIITARSDLRKQMKARGIKILAEQREEDKLVTEYLVRGYTNKFQMLYVYLRVEVQTRLAYFLKLDLTDKMTDP